MELHHRQRMEYQPPIPHTTPEQDNVAHSITATAASQVASSSSCARCIAFAAPSCTSPSDLTLLHGVATSYLEPFETLTPNLSQLAFTLHEPINKTTVPDFQWKADSFIDAEGFLIWTSCSEERIRQWNATQVTPPSSCSHAVNVYSTSSAFITAACEAVHSYVTSLSPAEFNQRYGRFYSMSQHGTMITELFDLHQASREASVVSTPPITSAVSFMILSTHVERLVGDIFCALRSSQATVCPRMLRDLFLTQELTKFLPQECMSLLQSLCGSPQSFNIRNILWHGFLSGTCTRTDEVLRKYADMLWLVWVGLLRECQRIWGEDTVQTAAPSEAGSCSSSSTASNLGDPSFSPPLPFRRPLRTSFLGDHLLQDYLFSDLFAMSGSDVKDPFSCWGIKPRDVFESSDEEFASTVRQFDRIVSASYLVPHNRVHDIVASLCWLRSNPYVAMVLLLPALEQILRHYFVYCNATVARSDSYQRDLQDHPHVVPGLLLAQSEQLFTTLDIVMANQVQPIKDCGNSVPVASAPTVPLQKCSRTSAFAFPLVPSACSFQPDAMLRNQIYLTSHPVLPQLMSHGVLFAIYDLLLSRTGPRLRDRLAHGEILWKEDTTLPAWLAVWTINVILGAALQSPIMQPASGVEPQLALPPAFTSSMATSTQACFSRYQPVTHARSLFMQQIVKTAQGSLRMQGEVREDETGPCSGDVSSVSGSTLCGTPSPSGSVLQWYRFALSKPLPLVTAHGIELFAAQGTQRNVREQANALAVRCGVLVRQMMVRETHLPIWPMFPRWIFDPAAPISAAQLPNLQMWYELSVDSFWSRSHTFFHHSSAKERSIHGCSIACQLQCFDECMMHAPVVALKRALDSLSSIPRSIEEALAVLRTSATSSDAPSGKRKLLVEAEASFPALLLCCATTLASLALLWEQLLHKAHPQSVTPTCSSSKSSLLQQDRSIARFLKKPPQAWSALVVNIRRTVGHWQWRSGKRWSTGSKNGTT